MHLNLIQGWCAGRDLNPHGISTTSPSNSRVCLFHHPRYFLNRVAQMNLPLPPVKVFLITLFPASFARLGWPTKVALGPASGRTSAKSRASSWPTHYFFSGVGT